MLPAGYQSRPVTDTDLGTVVELLHDYDRALGIEPESISAYLRWIWHVPYVDLERDTRLISGPSGAIAAFGQTVWDAATGGPLEVLGVVHPGHFGRGLGSTIVARGEELGEELGAEGIRVQVASVDAPARVLLQARGYAEVRTEFVMDRVLAPDEDPGSVPEGVKIRPFETGRDERAFHETHQASFADHWGFLPKSYEAFAAETFEGTDWDPTLVFVAESGSGGDQLAGLVLAIEQVEGGGFIATLSVRPGDRGRGIAASLLHRAFAELAARGHRDVTLMVDATNPTGAVRLYERVGMSVLTEFVSYDLGTAEVRGG